MNEKRVVITGIGVVSPVGTGRKAFWEALKKGASGIKPVTLFDVSKTDSKLAGEISDFDPELILGAKGLRNLDRLTKLALCAAKLALDDAGYAVTDENAHRTGVVFGTTGGSIASISEFDKESVRGGPRAVNPALFPNTVINSPASQISIRFNVKGFNATLSSGFTSGMDALRYAAQFIQLGRAEAVLCGAGEELCEATYKGFGRMGFLAKSRDGEISSPFDRNRRGAVLGEGAALFVLESAEHAGKRGAAIYGEVLGFGSGFDPRAYYRYPFRSEAPLRAACEAIRNSGIGPEAVDCVSTSANSSVTGDFLETFVLKKVFARLPKIPPVNASKSMLGETFSAGAAFQVASSLMLFSEKIAHPTINYREADDYCDLDCIANEARELDARYLLVNSLSPMGQNASLVLGRVA